MQPAKKLEYRKSYEDFYNKQRQKNLEIRRERREKKKIKLHRKKVTEFLMMSLIICGTVFGILSFLVFRYATIFELNYNIQGLEREIHILELEKENLYAQMNSTVVLKNVETVAMQDLGMQYPKAEQIVYLNQKWDYKLTDENKSLEIAEQPQFKNKQFLNAYMAFAKVWLSDE